jgi:hypothetical protein
LSSRIVIGGREPHLGLRRTIIPEPVISQNSREISAVEILNIASAITNAAKRGTLDLRKLRIAVADGSFIRDLAEFLRKHYAPTADPARDAWDPNR